MPTVDEFRRRLREVGSQAIVDEYILNDASEYISKASIAKIGARICATYQVVQADLDIWVVGSAKLGFSLTEKRTKAGFTLPRYRKFRPESDIDIAVVHPAVFAAIWNELTIHAHNAGRWPWDSGRLGDYLVCGWFRPDHFPRHARLMRCDQWHDCFRALSNDVTLGRRQVRGGLFYSREQLARYLQRAVDDCVAAEEMG